MPVIGARELSALAGASTSTIQLWVREGLIKAVPKSAGKGRGVHRRFNRRAAETAAILGQMHRFSVSLKGMRTMLQAFSVARRGSAWEDAARADQGPPVLAVFWVWEGKASVKIHTTESLPWTAIDHALVVNVSAAWVRAGNLFREGSRCLN